MAFSDTQAIVLEFFFGSALWGLSLATLMLCVHALLWGKTGLKSLRDVNRPMLAVSLAMPLIATADLALILYREIQIAGGGETDETFGSVTEVLRYACMQSEALMGDGMLVYRCWIVFGKSWHVALVPFLLWLAAVAFAVAIVVFSAILPGSATSGTPRFENTELAFWVISITLNILCTSLIVYRINAIDRTAYQLSLRSHSESPRTRNDLRRVVRVIVESGALYTISSILTLSTFAAKSIAVYPMTAIWVQMAPIAFHLIIIRSHHHSSRRYETTKGTTREFPLEFRTQHSDLSAPSEYLSQTSRSEGEAGTKVVVSC